MSENVSIESLPPELLLKILTKVKLSSSNKYEDYGNCQLVCTRWRAVLRRSEETVSWLFEQVLPFIRPYITRNDLLRLRLICKSWRQDVNNFRHKAPLHLCSPLYFTHPEDFTKYLAMTPSEYPFVDREVIFAYSHHVYEEQDLEEPSAYRFLQRFGVQMRQLTFFFEDHGSLRPSHFINLIRLLQLSLSIPTILHIDVNIAAGSGIEVDAYTVRDTLENFPLPQNANLESFAFSYDTWGDPTPLLQPIIASISTNLKKLKISSYVYVHEEGNDGLHSLNNFKFPQLIDLIVTVDTIQIVQRFLSNLAQPPNESHFQSLSIYVCHPVDISEIQGLLSIISSFRSSLVNFKINISTENTSNGEEISRLVNLNRQDVLSKCKQLSVILRRHTDTCF